MRVALAVVAALCVASAHAGGVRVGRGLQVVKDDTPAPTPSTTARPRPPTTTLEPTTSPPPPPTTPKPTPAPTQKPTTAPPTDEPTEEPTEAPTPKPTPKTTAKPTPSPTPEPTDAPTPEPTPETTKPPRTTVFVTDGPTTSKPRTTKPTPAPTEEVITEAPATTAAPSSSGLPSWVIPTIVGGAVFVFLTVLFLCNRLRRRRDSDDFGSEPSPYSANPHGTYQGAPVRKAAVLPPVNNNTTFMTNNSSFMQGQTPNYLYEQEQDYTTTQDRSSIGVYDGRNSSLSYDHGSVPSFDGRFSSSYERSSGLFTDRTQSGRHVCLDEEVEARRASAFGTLPANRITSPQSIQSYTF